MRRIPRALACSVSLAAFVLTAASCSQDDSPAPEVTGVELSTPINANSGEPYLSATGDQVVLSWIESVAEGGHDLRFSSWDGDGWAPAKTIQHSDDFFVNWADFPSVTVGEDGTLWAHWLERGAMGGYDYGVRIVRSADGGESWSEPWTIHEDTSPTEHGFVAPIPTTGGMAFVWLDGRNTGSGVSAEDRAMTLRYRYVSSDGNPGPDRLVDAKVCDCCQTDAALTADGPIVVYRDRTDDEIRDIYATRLIDGEWTKGAAVFDDGWEIGGCPVNGPAVAAEENAVAVAWFTGAQDTARVRVAFSDDAGSTFAPAVRIDDGFPIGRVDVLMRNSQTALVSWLEGTGGDGAQVRARTVRSDGTMSESVTLSTSSGARASGFPRMIQTADGSVLLAWTDVSGEPQVRVQRLEIEGL